MSGSDIIADVTPRLSIEFKATGIPYSRSGDPESHSYVNLKESPDSIHLLPELLREPELREQVVRLNRQDAAVETVGCECWIAPTELGSGQDGYRKGSYIATIFSNPMLGTDAQHWFWVFFQVSKALEEEGNDHPEHSMPPVLRIEFILKPFENHAQSNSGFQCEIWVEGAWSTEVEAHRVWTAWLRTAVDTFDRITREFASFHVVQD